MTNPPAIEIPPGPLSLEFFEQLPAGTELTLYYWCYNRGDMRWQHSHVEGDRVHGAFWDDRPGADCWTPVADYLYEFMGYVCRGSGAEPVHGIEPTAADYWDD